MIEHDLIQAAIRTKLATLSVLTTGSATLAATATGYSRSTGSFLTDGFWPGMEITPSGFTSNPVDILKAVTATILTTKSARTVEAASAGRTIAVLLPTARAWENVEFTPPVEGNVYIEEQYLPGPSTQVTLGPGGELEATPMYQVQIHVPEGYGALAARRYLDAIFALFAPRTAIAVNGDVLRVRSDTGPFFGQLRRVVPGFASASVTIPFRLYTANAI